MQQLKKKMKILVDDPKAIEYLQKNNLVSVQFNELHIRASNIAHKLQSLSQLETSFPEMIEQKIEQKITPLVEENKSLKVQLQEKVQPVEQYEQQITELQNEIRTLTRSYEESVEKIESQGETIIELQENKRDLEDKVKELYKTSSTEEELKDIVGKFGSYGALRKLSLLVSVFTEYPDAEFRLTEILKNPRLLEAMSKYTIRRILYIARDLKIIHCPRFEGTYKLNISGFDDMSVDMDKIAKYILGDEVYEIAKKQSFKKEEFEKPHVTN